MVRNRIILLMIVLLFFSCAKKTFMKSNIQSKAINRFEFEDMTVKEGSAILPSGNGSMIFWSWGTVTLDLSRFAMFDTVHIKFSAKEDYFPTEHAKLQITVPCINGSYSQSILWIDSTDFKIFETTFYLVYPGIWEFSFINDKAGNDTYPLGRNLTADWIEFEFNENVKPKNFKLDSLYFSDDNFPKTVHLVWSPPVGSLNDSLSYDAYYDSTIFYVPEQAKYKISTEDTIIDIECNWYDIYGAVIAIHPDGNRSAMSNIAQGKIIIEQGVQNKGDFDNSGKIDFPDLLEICKRYGAYSSDILYSAILDFNDDGQIYFDDLLSFIFSYGTIFETKNIIIN